MKLTPREVAFLLDETRNIEDDETRYPSVRSEARRIRKKAAAVLAETEADVEASFKESVIEFPLPSSD
ncbi:hypothetical protein [Haloferax volcanii]|uniref:hypothetical protein n=1 Tax=Haloferax volcanii TaxID=2246 RepID=UPI0023DA7B76|nr:hypothetical protein [Haloferax lucentense]WEL25924.1 hypothetical protein SVXHx_1614 [Haloferax lucentense]